MMRTYESEVKCWEWIDVDPQKHHFQVSLTLDTLDEGFRDRVLNMVQSALSGQTLDVQEKKSTIGFHQEEEDES